MSTSPGHSGFDGWRAVADVGLYDIIAALTTILEVGSGRPAPHVPTDEEAKAIYLQLFRDAGSRVLVEYRLDWQLNTVGESEGWTNVA